MSAHQSLPVLDSKTRRKLEEQRRMAYRRAIEAHAEQRRLESEFDDIPQQIAANYLNIALAPFPRSAR